MTSSQSKAPYGIFLFVRPPRAGMTHMSYLDAMSAFNSVSTNVSPAPYGYRSVKRKIVSGINDYRMIVCLRSGPTETIATGTPSASSMYLM